MEDKITTEGGEAMFYDSSLAIKITKTGCEIIEDIAWQMFLDGLGIRLSRKLTSEEMGKITSDESYEYYRQKATKLYEKKQRAVLNKKYPVIDVPASGNRDWSGGAYCLCFVYSKYKGNFVLRGYIKEVEEYLKKNYTHYFYNKSLWHHSQNRDIWGFWKKDIGIFTASLKEKRKKTQIRPYYEYEIDEANLKAKTFEFKRLPKRWIPEFDKF